jgi:hypothetical protein
MTAYAIEATLLVTGLVQVEADSEAEALSKFRNGQWEVDLSNPEFTINDYCPTALPFPVFADADFDQEDIAPYVDESPLPDPIDDESFEAMVAADNALIHDLITHGKPRTEAEAATTGAAIVGVL